jgi:copper ion binding protein
MCKTCGCHGTKLEKLTVQVDGMSCDHCKQAVEKAARGLPGVMAADVDLAAKTLTLEFDAAKTELAEIEQAVEAAGYTVAR